MQTVNILALKLFCKFNTEGLSVDNKQVKSFKIFKVKYKHTKP